MESDHVLHFYYLLHDTFYQCFTFISMVSVK